MLGMFFSQSVTVETYTGPGDFGDTYAAPVDVVGLLDDGLRLTTDGPTGDVVEAVTAFYCPISEAAKFVPESKVTTPTGVMQVETAKHRQASPIFGNVAHLEVRLK
jgi:hypothetical protein